MSKHSLRIGLLALSCVSLVAVARAQDGAVVAHDAWMREPMQAGKVSAVFVVLENTSGEDRSLTAVSTTAAKTAELHNMVMEGSTMRMTPVKAIAIKARSTTELKPGSYHIMLFELTAPPAIGSTIDLTLTLDNGQRIPIKAEVRKAGEMK